MDETTVQVLHYDEADDARSKSYMWLATGGPKEKPAVIYRYFKNRNAANVKEFIDGFSGFLMTDGYAGYMTAVEEHNKLYPDEKITHACCLAHARRKFNDALIVSKRKSGSAQTAISHIRKIYMAEDKLRSTCTDAELVAGRKEVVLPLFEEFHEWLAAKKETAVQSGPLNVKIVDIPYGIESAYFCIDIRPFI